MRPLALVAAILVVAGADNVCAQARPEFRGEAIFSERTAVYVGAGVLFPMGTYLRSGVVAAAGISEGSGTFRGDLISIFHADPFRESRWAPYGGGGISFRRDSDLSRTNAYLLATLGVEGPSSRGLSTAFELGLGGGVRTSVVIRRSQPHKR